MHYGGRIWVSTLGFQFCQFQILDQPLAYPIQFCELWLVELINQQGDTLNVCIYDFWIYPSTYIGLVGM
jgi:hypothetical protein